MKSVINFVVLWAISITLTQQEGCNISLFRTWESAVLYSDNFEVVYPSLENAPGDRNITIPIGATIIISCDGGRFSPNYTTTKTIVATCNQDSKLEVQDKILDFDNLDCINFSPSRVEISSTACATDSVLIKAGFEVGLNIKFIPQVEVCFHTRNLSALYVNYNLTKYIGFRKTSLVTSYYVDSVYQANVDFDRLYNNVTFQQQIVNSLLGLPLNSSRYVDSVSCNPYPGVSTPGFCFSMRNLAFRLNFVYTFLQKATYRYINVVPQWYFLDYNLDKLEYDVINYVTAYQLDLEVYTGTFGVATLPHSTTGEETELFLYVDDKNTTIPIPALFWKLIYDRITQRATVFFTVNNPHLTENEVSGYILCDDISDQFAWLTWNKKNITRGYSYACNYSDAKAVVSYLPELAVEEILV